MEKPSNVDWAMVLESTGKKLDFVVKYFEATSLVSNPRLKSAVRGSITNYSSMRGLKIGAMFCLKARDPTLMSAEEPWKQ